MNQKINHVIAQDNGTKFHCWNCNESYNVNLPCPLTMYSLMLNEFLRLHANCRPRDAGRPDIAGHEIPDAEGLSHGQ